MAKIRLKNKQAISRRVQNALNKFAIGAKNEIKIVGQEYIESIRKQALNPVTGKTYKQLKQSSIESRRRIASSNPTHAEYRSSKPNLTITGSFLDSFVSMISGTRKLILEIKPTGNHPGYKNKNGTRGKSVPNIKIAEGMEAIGRPVLSISKKRSDLIVARLRQLLKRALR